MLAALLERAQRRLEASLPDAPWLREPILASARFVARPARKLLEATPFRGLFPRRRGGPR